MRMFHFVPIGIFWNTLELTEKVTTVSTGIGVLVTVVHGNRGP